MITAIVLARVMMSHSNEAHALRTELDQMATEDVVTMFSQVRETAAKDLGFHIGF